MSTSAGILMLGAAMAGVVQGISGFAFGLVSLSLWAWFMAPQELAVYTLCGSLAGQLLAAVTLRRSWNLRVLAPYLVGGALGVPLGVWLLPRLDAALFKVILGGLLLVWCPTMLAARRLPHVSASGPLGRVLDGFSGLGGGVLGGLGGYTGLIPTLWCNLRAMGKEEQRMVVQNFNLAAQCITFAAFWQQGLLTASLAPGLMVVVPTALASAWLGTRIYRGLSEVRFRQVILTLLALSGVALLRSGLAGW